MADRLEQYRAKRDAASTPEPMGGADGGAGDRPRFVIQEHQATRMHWDLRLERDGALASWAVPNGIPQTPGENRKAVHTEDHPLEYLTFEGEIPKGQYGAGTMTVWETGTYECLKWTDRKVEIRLHGERGRVAGRYALFATGRAGEEERDWMIHRMDPPAEVDGRPREPFPERVAPMLARASPDLPPDDARWAYEVKWDGVRAVCLSQPGRLRLESRNLRDITAAYPEIRRMNRALGAHEAVLDGEIVAFDEHGRPSFNRLQRRMHVTSERAIGRLERDVPVVYIAFDLLWLDGRSLMDEPYEERRARLLDLGLQGPAWQTPDHVVGGGEAFLAASREQGLEGIVAKRLGSCYEPGRRSGAWRKVKNVQREEVLIGGWLPGEGRRRERIGALLVGVREDGALRYAGRVGTGFTEDELDRLAARLAPLERAESAFSGRQPPRGAVHVEPSLACQVEFIEWTPEGMLRAPSYKGLREPGPPPRAVKLTNLDKVLYPSVGFTKGDVIGYLRAIAPVLLPHLKDRPLTLKRYPDGVDGDFFFEKQCPRHRPDWVRTERVRSRTKTIEFCLADDVDTLVWLGNLADLELHTSLARVPATGRPTILAFDLDPGAPATIVECSRVGLLIQGMLGGLGLQAFAKTSGSKGLQVYVPLNVDDVSFDDTKRFARTVAELLESSEPGLVVSRMTKSLRPGKVLVDWSQNDEHKTTVNVYSLRARARPTVSTPVTWDEVRACAESGDPDRLVFDHAEVLRRVDEHGDLFAPVLSLVQPLPRGG